MAILFLSISSVAYSKNEELKNNMSPVPASVQQEVFDENFLHARLKDTGKKSAEPFFLNRSAEELFMMVNTSHLSHVDSLVTTVVERMRDFPEEREFFIVYGALAGKRALSPYASEFDRDAFRLYLNRSIMDGEPKEYFFSSVLLQSIKRDPLHAIMASIEADLYFSGDISLYLRLRAAFGDDCPKECFQKVYDNINNSTIKSTGAFWGFVETFVERHSLDMSLEEEVFENFLRLRFPNNFKINELLMTYAAKKEDWVSAAKNAQKAFDNSGLIYFKAKECEFTTRFSKSKGLSCFNQRWTWSDKLIKNHGSEISFYRVLRRLAQAEKDKNSHRAIKVSFDESMGDDLYQIKHWMPIEWKEILGKIESSSVAEKILAGAIAVDPLEPAYYKSLISLQRKYDKKIALETAYKNLIMIGSLDSYKTYYESAVEAGDNKKIHAMLTMATMQKPESANLKAFILMKLGKKEDSCGIATAQESKKETIPQAVIELGADGNYSIYFSGLHQGQTGLSNSEHEELSRYCSPPVGLSASSLRDTSNVFHNFENSKEVQEYLKERPLNLE